MDVLSGTETNIIHREKKGRLWAQEIKRCERGSFRANRKRIAVVCDFLLIRGFWRLFQALCHLPVSLTTALQETRWSLGIHRLAFVRGLTHAADAGSRSAHAVRWITWSSHLVLTSAYSLESDTYLDQTHRRSAIHFMVGFRNSAVDVISWTQRWAFARANSLRVTNYRGALSETVANAMWERMWSISGFARVTRKHRPKSDVSML